MELKRLVHAYNNDKNIQCAKCHLKVVSGNHFKFNSSYDFHVQTLDKDHPECCRRRYCVMYLSYMQR